MKNKIGVLLLPIGRNLPDIDIIGLDYDGNEVIAQVTSNPNNAEIRRKLNKLLAYKSKKLKMYFFGPSSKKDIIKKQNLEYISSEHVFNELTKNKDSIQNKMISKMLNRE